MKKPLRFWPVSITLAVLLLALLIPTGSFAAGNSAGRVADALSARVMCDRYTVSVAGESLSEMWTMDYNGGSLAKLHNYADPPYNTKHAVYSPNGAWIAFEATDKNPTYKSTAICLANYDGSNPAQVTPSMDVSQVPNPIYAGGCYSELFECPTFSADSSKIFFTATLVQRDAEGKIIYKDPRTGDPMVYISDLWKVNVDGTGCGPVRTFETASEMFPEGSPVGDRIAQTQMMGSMTDYQWTNQSGYMVGRAANAGIFTLNSTGGNYSKVVPTVAVMNPAPATGNMVTDFITPYMCAWSPDGSKLAISYYWAHSERTYGVVSYYDYGISVVDANTTNDIRNDWTNWNSPQYWYGTRITPVGWPGTADTINFNCQRIEKLSWSADGRNVVFEVPYTPPGVTTTGWKSNIYAIDVSNLAAPGTPVNVSKDNISSWPCASPATLGNVTTAPVPNPPFYLAEGNTLPDFDEYMAIQNPNNEDATVNLNYLYGGGRGDTGGNKTVQVLVKKKSRKTVKVWEDVGRNKSEVSVSISSTKGVIVERPVYFNYGASRGLNWTGGHDVVGATAPQKTWYFAEGSTRDNATDGAFEEYLCLQNPNKEDAKVTITYMLGTGKNLTKQVTVKKESRSTVNVLETVPKNQDVSAKVVSDKPIVAERPMYFNYKRKWTGGHDVIGATAPQKTWYFAEGTTRNNPNDGYFDEFLCLQNPNSSAAKVTVTYMLGTGKNITKQYTVNPKSRRTVVVNSDVGNNQDVSCKVTSDKPIVAERPVYFNNRDNWNGGHDVVGALSPKNTWYFAEGTTLDNFSEWISIQNPNSTDIKVNITYMLTDGKNVNQQVDVKKKSRKTVDVKLKLGKNKHASAKVTCDTPIIVERPMYFNYNGKWTGGHDVIGYSP